MAHLQEAAVKQIKEICDRYKDELAIHSYHCVTPRPKPWSSSVGRPPLGSECYFLIVSV